MEGAHRGRSRRSLASELADWLVSHLARGTCSMVCSAELKPRSVHRRRFAANCEGVVHDHSTRGGRIRRTSAISQAAVTVSHVSFGPTDMAAE